MKIALVALLFAASAFAQSPASGLPAACGPAKASFDVALDKSQHTLAQPEAGKARVYFIQDNGGKALFGLYSAAYIGIDGAWAGAYRSDSYFFVSVEPGEHHVCASMKSLATGHQVEFAHFTAEAGKIYYFRTRLFLMEHTIFFELNPVDSDEATYLIVSYPLSVSKPKK